MTGVVHEPVPVRYTKRPTDSLPPFAVGLRVLRNLSWSCIGSILFCASLGFFIASLVLVSVLKEIGQKNFTEPLERIKSYSSLFQTARARGCKVEEDKPSLHEGVTTYLWTVQVPGSEELVVFRWQHDLNTNSITAMSGPAVMADLELGYYARREAEANPLYDAEDTLAQQAIRLGLGQKPNLVAAEATPDTDLLKPPLPPLISPDDARHRGGVTEETETENPCGTAVATEEVPPGDHTEARPPGEESDAGEAGNTPGGGGLDEPPPDAGAGGSGNSGEGGEDGAVPVG